MQDKLGSASSWSNYDTYLGGGMIASAVKHSRLDEAAALASQADRQLATLRTELTTVGQLAPQLTVSSGARFVDIWFNNIFTDLAFADRIRQAQQNTVQAIQTVSSVQQKLESRRAEVQDRLGAMQTRRDELLQS